MFEQLPAPPRYTPCAIVGSPIAAWYDSQGKGYVALCPECHNLIVYRTLYELCSEMVFSERSCCEGCRARALFESDPNWIGAVLDAWMESDTFPQSPSWMEAIPDYGYTVWESEILASLSRATVAQ